MKRVVVLFAASLTTALWAADECTFDQENQFKVLSAIATGTPGAKVDLEKHQIIWILPGGETTTFGYGGCAHLGSTVTLSAPLPTPRTKEQVFEVAGKLAARFWSNKDVSESLATDTLVNALKSGRYAAETRDGKTIFEVSDPTYVELYATHEFKAGVDTVSIGWQGNY